MEVRKEKKNHTGVTSFLRADHQSLSHSSLQRCSFWHLHSTPNLEFFFKLSHSKPVAEATNPTHDQVEATQIASDSLNLVDQTHDDHVPRYDKMLSTLSPGREPCMVALRAGRWLLVARSIFRPVTAHDAR